ncbi:hypothetical protein FC764_10235 [Clostridium botulinum]|nr:hypothetical protein [Clostridium botulinum]
MKKFFYLFKVSFEKSIKELIRYKFNTISDIVSLCVLFMAMFYGMKLFGLSMDVSPVNLGDTLEGFVVGYFLWTIMLMAYSDTANNVINDANTGTLEQISMSNLGLYNILFARSICNLILDLFVCFVILLIIMFITGYWINIDVVSLLIIIFIGIFSILGISLVFGGLALIFKKIKSILNIIQYFLLGLIIPPLGAFNDTISALLPFRKAIEEVFKITMGGLSFMDFSIGEYSVMIVNSLAYFIIGILIFKLCSYIAKKNGLLGQY